MEVSEARINLTSSTNNSVRLSNLSLRLEPEAVGTSVHVKGRSDLSVGVANINGQPMEFTTQMQIEGFLGTQPSGIEAVVRVEEVHSGFGTMSSQKILTSWDGQILRLDAGNDHGPFALTVTVNPSRHILSFDLVANEFRPLRVFKPSGPIAKLDDLLNNDFSGAATVVVDTSVSDLESAVNYSGTISF